MIGRGGYLKRIPRLERKFGFFHCDCVFDSSWTSAHVYCVLGTRKVFFRQECQFCGEAQFPKSVQNLRCRFCGHDVKKCKCDWSSCGFYLHECECQFSNGSAKSHRSDLCEKCKAGIPC